MSEIEIKNSINLIDYESSIRFMQSRVREIQNSNQKELLWFLNHDHIYTQGTSANKSEIINQTKIKIIKSNRGGKTTYHGPGQRIVYFMIDLNNKKKDIRKFITIIEKSLMDFLKNYQIDSTTYKERVGIWVTGKNGKKFNQEEKIGAIGLRLKNWVTYHGLSFNINPKMDNYKFIDACGLKNFKNTSLHELDINITEENFDKEFSLIFLNNLRNLK